MEDETKQLSQLAADLLGGNEREGRRIVQILEEAHIRPEASATNIEAAVFSVELDPPVGFRSLWVVLHRKCLVTVVETMNGNRAIVEVFPMVPHTLH